MQEQLKEKDELIEVLEQRTLKRSREQEDLFSSSISSTLPPTSGAWKSMVDRLVKEKDAKESYYKKEIKRIRVKYQPGFGSSSDMIP